MLIYLLGFFISCFILWATKDWKAKSIGFVLCSIVALLIPCLIAGLRDSSIGTDVEVYATTLLDAADQSDSFLELWNGTYYHGSHYYRDVSILGLGFVALTWLISKTADTLFALLFCTQLLTIVPIFLGLLRFRDKVPTWLGMAVYYLLYFNQSLNIMRQWIAMGILFFGLYYLSRREFLKYSATILVASVFHTSAFLGFFVLGVYVFATAEGIFSRRIRMMIMIILAALLLGSLSIVAEFLTFFGLDRYAAYLGDFEISLLWKQLVLRLPVIVLLALNWSRLEEATPLASLFVVMASFDLLISQLGSIRTDSSRIGLYFSEYAIISLPFLTASGKGLGNKERIVKLVNTAAIIGYSLLYWYMVYVVQGWSETIPYALGI